MPQASTAQILPSAVQAPLFELPPAAARTSEIPANIRYCLWYQRADQRHLYWKRQWGEAGGAYVFTPEDKLGRRVIKTYSTYNIARRWKSVVEAAVQQKDPGLLIGIVIWDVDGQRPIWGMTSIPEGAP